MSIGHSWKWLAPRVSTQQFRATAGAASATTAQAAAVSETFFETFSPMERSLLGSCEAPHHVLFFVALTAFPDRRSTPP